ncbi:MAG: CDP-diacylglycerol--serine O-phosphatidyltransferase [Mailhella sp.]|nr:CDP-diacylglycerol--serine O-phosphatidyltransferase [Mailhella sp.]
MHTPKKPVARGFYILPNLFTTGSLFCGFFSVILAFKGQFDLAAWAILASAMLDGCDGKVARLTGTSSQFGVEYDSLADDVAFGVAPGMLAYAWQLHNFGRLGLAVSFLYCACAALRLARFNVGVATTSKRFFVGLPSPASACVMACFVLFMPYYPKFLEPALPAFTLIVATAAPLLMVSRVRYFSFKEFGFVKAHPYQTMVATLLVASMIFSIPRLFCFLLLMAYIISGPAYTFYLHRQGKTFDPEAAEAARKAEAASE